MGAEPQNDSQRIKGTLECSTWRCVQNPPLGQPRHADHLHHQPLHLFSAHQRFQKNAEVIRYERSSVSLHTEIIAISEGPFERRRKMLHNQIFISLI
jgi:hypothetical protein